LLTSVPRRWTTVRVHLRRPAARVRALVRDRASAEVLARSMLFRLRR